MVRSYVEHNRHVGFEVIHVFKLKTAELDDIYIMFLPGHLKSEAFAYIACETHVYACVFKYMVGEQSSRCLAVATGYAHHLCVGVTSGKLYF